MSERSAPTTAMSRSRSVGISGLPQVADMDSVSLRIEYSPAARSVGARSASLKSPSVPATTRPMTNTPPATMLEASGLIVMPSMPMTQSTHRVSTRTTTMTTASNGTR